MSLEICIRFLGTRNYAISICLEDSLMFGNQDEVNSAKAQISVHKKFSALHVCETKFTVLCLNILIHQISTKYKQNLRSQLIHNHVPTTRRIRWILDANPSAQ